MIIINAMSNQLQIIPSKTLKKRNAQYDPDKIVILTKAGKRLISALWQANADIGKTAKLLNMKPLLLLAYISNNGVYKEEIRRIRELQISDIESKVYEDATEGDASKQMFVLERKGNWIKKAENSGINDVKVSININFVSAEAKPEAIVINPEGENAVQR